MSGLGEYIYLKSPVWMQQAAVATYGWWWYRRRFSAHFHRLVGEYKERERWTSEQLQDYQETQLDKVLAAARHSPYYRQALVEAGIKGDTPPLDALARMPLLSKDALRLHARDLVTQDPLPKGTLVQKTSGTTGTPTEIYYDLQFHAMELAVPEARNLHWAGVNYRDRRVMFGVRKVCRFSQDRPPFWRFSPVEDMAYASIYHLSYQFLPAYLEFLGDYRPAVVMGYPSALYAVARHALDTGDLPTPARAVFTTSETVTEQMREAIEAAWQCRIFDRYGAVEGCVFASQCEHGRYHVSPEVGLIEILDTDGLPCPPGQVGEVICTGLQNTLQPLIRYRIGDAARWSTEKMCPCGRSLPMLEAIEGRFEDMCYTPDGRQTLRFDAVFKGVTKIREAQVVQERPDLFVIRVIPADGFSQQDIDQIQNNMRLHVGAVETRVQPVREIPRSASGKFRAVVCHLSAEQKETLRRNGVGHSAHG
jgi:phenylacetate-CoA ligase